MPPERSMPAKSPCAREYERISAVSNASVPTWPWRPIGPAATDASAPRFTLFCSIFCAPDSFITSSTTSTCSAPAWNPRLPLASCMKTGALHWSPARQLMTPLPYSPPMMNAAFFSSGMTTTQRARVQYSGGTWPRISCMARVAALSRAVSAGVIAAVAPVAPASTTVATTMNRYMNTSRVESRATHLPRQNRLNGRAYERVKNRVIAAFITGPCARPDRESASRPQNSGLGLGGASAPDPGEPTPVIVVSSADATSQKSDASQESCARLRRAHARGNRERRRRGARSPGRAGGRRRRRGGRALQRSFRRNAAARRGAAGRSRRADAVSAGRVGRACQAPDGRHRNDRPLPRSDRRRSRRRAVRHTERQPSPAGAQEARREDGDRARHPGRHGRVQDPGAQHRKSAQPPREVARNDSHGARAGDDERHVRQTGGLVRVRVRAAPLPDARHLL